MKTSYSIISKVSESYYRVRKILLGLYYNIIRHAYYSVEHSEKTAKGHVYINWNLFSICNFNCSYCRDTLHNGKLKGVDIEIIMKSILKFKNHYHGKDIFFELTGGEVTYYEHLPMLLKFIKGHGLNAGVISNGSRDIEYWKGIVNYLDRVVLSYHTEYSDSEHFVSIVKYLGDQIPTYVNIMLNPSHINKCIELATKIYTIPRVTVWLAPLYVDLGAEKYQYEIKQLKDISKTHKKITSFKKSNFKELKTYRGPMVLKSRFGKNKIYDSYQILSKKLNNWSGWYCYAGVENFNIEPNGDVKGAFCSSAGTFLGNISSSFTIPTKPIKCTSSFCHCQCDIMCTKIKKLRGEREK